MTFEFCAQRPLSCETDSVRICGQGIDGSTRTVRTDVNNVLATIPSASTQSQMGRLFSSSFITTLTEGNPNAQMVIDNPSDSGRIMYIDSVFGGNRITDISAPNNRLPIEIFILQDPTPGPNPLDTRNLNYGSTEISAMTSTFAFFAGGTFVAEKAVVLGSFDFNFEGAIIVPPGHSFGVQFSPGGSLTVSSIRVLVTVIWYELDVGV